MSIDWCQRAVEVCWNAKKNQIREPERATAKAAYDEAAKIYEARRNEVIAEVCGVWLAPDMNSRRQPFAVLVDLRHDVPLRLCRSSLYPKHAGDNELMVEKPASGESCGVFPRGPLVIF